MQYDFSKFFKNSDENALDEFIEQYTSYLNVYDADDAIVTFKNYYQEIFNTFKAPFEEEKLLSLFEKLAHHKASLDLPYVIVTNELYALKNIILSRMLEENNTAKILELITLFKHIKDKIAYIYLVSYINKLLSLNNVRLSSLSDLIDKSIIGYYEAHLLWLTNLAICAKDKQKEDFPELDENMCEFGKWLTNKAKPIIQNNSKYKTIMDLHHNLHFFGSKIYSYIEKDEYHLLITYLEKCELISLSIGTELALINNILLNKKVIKDSLTGALSRESLKGIFESQYELSLATDSPFVLAMCDLDRFKMVNDTYGHIGGDKMLEHFVGIVKKHLRNSDIIIRYGGEEFVIILPSIRKEKAYEVLDNIRQNFEKSIVNFNNQEMKTTVSMGMIEIYPEYIFKPSDLDEYISVADKKLYRAKNSGRNMVVMN